MLHSLDCIMDDHLRRRIRCLTMRLDYQTWWESFANPVDYRPELYAELGLNDDFVITFGYRGSSIRVPLVLFCALSYKLHMMVLSKPRRGLSICLKGEHAYPFWWLRNFLQHKTPLPGAEGTALVLLMAHRFGIDCLISMCSDKLGFYLSIDYFTHVYNAAVETQDENLLEQCGYIIAAWTDELLSLSNLSVLGKKAMLALLTHPNLSPSSELNVFNSIINWWRNRGEKCYNDKCFLEDLRLSLDKVKFLLLTEQEFKCNVVPCGVVPFEDVEIMLGMIRGEIERRRGLAYYIHNPVLQETPRPKLVKIVHFGVQRAGQTLPELRLVYTKNIDDRPIAWFTVDKLCRIRRISSPSIMDEGSGTLTVSNKHGFKASQKWVQSSSTFEQPLVLRPNIPYDFVHNSKTGLSDEECSVTMKKTVGDVTFEGLLFCTYLTLEFITTNSESESESSSSESENDSVVSSSEGNDIEVIQEAEVRELQVSAAEQDTTRNGGAEGQGSRKQNGEGVSPQAAAEQNGEGVSPQAATEKVNLNNEENKEPVINIPNPRIFRKLLEDALVEV